MTDRGIRLGGRLGSVRWKWFVTIIWCSRGACYCPTSIRYRESEASVTFNEHKAPKATVVSAIEMVIIRFMIHFYLKIECKKDLFIGRFLSFYVFPIFTVFSRRTSFSHLSRLLSSPIFPVFSRLPSFPSSPIIHSSWDESWRLTGR